MTDISSFAMMLIVSFAGFFSGYRNGRLRRFEKSERFIPQESAEWRAGYEVGYGAARYEMRRFLE